MSDTRSTGGALTRERAKICGLDATAEPLSSASGCVRAPSVRGRGGVARLAFVFASATCALLAFSFSPAFAAQTRPFIASFGTLSNPHGVAIDQSSGNVYVADTGNNRIEKFDASGNFLLAFGADVGGPGANTCTSICSAGTSGSSPGQFTTAEFVAVDNSAGPSVGDVYVADTGDNRVSKFDSAGNLVASWGTGGQLSSFEHPLAGLTVDTSGDLIVFDTNSTQYVFSQSGSSASKTTLTRVTLPNGVAVDAAGNFLKVNGDRSVEKFGSSGNDLGQVSSEPAFPNGANAIAIEPGSGDLYVANSGDSIDHYAFDGSGNVIEPGSTTCAVAPFAGCGATDSSPIPFAGAGIAVSSATGNTYLSNPSTGQVYEFGLPATVPDVATSAASNLQPSSSTLNGTINPDGIQVTACQFEYGTTAAYGQTAACAQSPASIGSGSSPVAVSADISGFLQPDTTYHFRLNAANANGANISQDATFTTTGPPIIDAESTTNVSAVAASLQAQIDPSAFDTTYHFEYGTTTGYGTSIPIPDSDIGAGTSDVPVNQDISGLTASTTYHFRVVATNSQGTVNGPDQTFTTQPPAQIDCQATANVAKTTATLQACINPDGIDTTYHFEYGTTTSYGTSIPVPDADIGAGTSDVPVSQDIAGLSAGATYHFRVVATNSQGTVNGTDQTFTAIPAAQIDSATVTDLSATGATLNAQINPLGDDTTYHFEYGTDTSYGTRIPVPDAGIGSGTIDVAVFQHISGLAETPTTYHWRVVATNSTGTILSPDHTFIYDTTGAGLPDNRAYEMVTPPRKNGALISTVGGGSLFPGFSADGSRAELVTLQCFGDAESCPADREITATPYGFSRTSSGWIATALAPATTAFGGSTGFLSDPEEGTALFSVPTANGNDAFYARRADDSFADIGPVNPAGGVSLPPNASEQRAATADFSHLVWENRPGWPIDLTTGGKSVYEYVGTGNSQPLLVGVTGGRGSTDLVSRCGTELSQNPGRLSVDGRTVYFTAAGGDECVGSGPNAAIPVPVDELFARIDESRRVAISARSPADCTGSCLSSPPANARFQGASTDGSKAFFTSTQQLTNGASEDSTGTDTARGAECTKTTGANGCNLYLYDFGNPAGAELVDVSAGDTSGGGPRVQGVMATSSDGSHAYFVAKGVLTAAPNAQGQTASDGGENLYVFERDTAHPAGRTAFIATLSGATPCSTGVDCNQWVGLNGPLANVTPDGRFLVFTSNAHLTPDVTSTSGAQQVFRYDDQTGQLVRVSIGEHGFNDNGNPSSAKPCGSYVFFCSQDASIVTPVGAIVQAGAARRDPTMADDGSYVFFQSPVGLTPHALDEVQIGTDGTGAPYYAQNVYEWHDGHVSLISDGEDTSVSGNARSAVVLIGADATGANVFFGSSDPLVPQDTDTEGDVYDARICTPASPCIRPPATATACQGDECQGTANAPPAVPLAATVTFSGPGNANPGASPAAAKPRVLTRAVRGSLFTISVSVPGGGRIAITGAPIRAIRMSVAHAGTYRLRVTLTAAEKRALRHKHKLKLKLRATYTPAGASPSVVSFQITDKA
jgi:sugar lactone lactonase YvrE